MLSRIINIDAKGQSLVFELQDGIAVPPTYDEFAKRGQSGHFFILRNIKDQGITAFYASPNPAEPKVLQKIFPQSLSDKIIQKNHMRVLRAPREVKAHEQSINPTFTNLGKIGQTITPDMRPIRLDPHIRYLWLHNAAGEMILGVEHIWDYASKCEFHARSTEEVEALKNAIIANFIVPYLEAEDKMKLNKQQLAEKQKEMSLLAKHQAKRGILALESVVGKRELPEETLVEPVKQQAPKKQESEKKLTEETSTKINKMLKLKGGFGHASLSPVYRNDGNLESLRGEAYIAGEIVYKEGQRIFTNRSGRFFSDRDSEASNRIFLAAGADYLSRRTGETIHVVLEKNKLDPEFLWDKGLHVKIDEFKGDKVKIAFNCISKVYKFNSSYTTARKLEKKLVHAEKELIFDKLFPKDDISRTPEERFTAAIVYFLDTILSFEKTEAVRMALVKQIQYMIEHQLSESFPPARREALLDCLKERTEELWELGKDGAIEVRAFPFTERAKLKI